MPRARCDAEPPCVVSSSFRRSGRVRGACRPKTRPPPPRRLAATRPRTPRTRSWSAARRGFGRWSRVGRQQCPSRGPTQAPVWRRSQWCSRRKSSPSRPMPRNRHCCRGDPTPLGWPSSTRTPEPTRWCPAPRESTHPRPSSRPSCCGPPSTWYWCRHPRRTPPPTPPPTPRGRCSTLFPWWSPPRLSTRAEAERSLRTRWDRTGRPLSSSPSPPPRIRAS
mmetsp:Transcript_10489/g.17776  ORF Transcript_10489/g.17776 Transcript_10489/m.17776 type:complete len:221 (-) Transcript_10489:669-1331(-)